eukprot:4917393-Prymnesium_polylepis.1
MPSPPPYTTPCRMPRVHGRPAGALASRPGCSTLPAPRDAVRSGSRAWHQNCCEATSHAGQRSPPTIRTWWGSSHRPARPRVRRAPAWSVTAAYALVQLLLRERCPPRPARRRDVAPAWDRSLAAGRVQAA